MERAFTLILAGLACYRLSHLFAAESGPGRIFKKLRRVPRKGSATAEGLSCPFCLSLWFSALITGYMFWAGFITSANETPLYWLAVSATAIICNQQWTGD